MATAPIRPLAWEPPYAADAAQEKAKRQIIIIIIIIFWSSHCGSVLTNPTSILEDAGSIPGLEQWVKDLVLP